MKKKAPKYDHRASASDYLRVLACYPNFTRLLSAQGKQYDKLHDWLLEKEYHFQDESYDLPTVKKLSMETGIASEKIPKYLRAIYEDILLLNDEKPNLFRKDNQILCSLSFNYLGNYHLFKIGLDLVPRIGDSLTFFFIEPQIGGRLFYVKRVYHDLGQDGQSIAIRLSSGSPNSYLKLLKDKAYLHKEISFNDYWNDEVDTELQRQLLSRFDKL